MIEFVLIQGPASLNGYQCQRLKEPLSDLSIKSGAETAEKSLEDRFSLVCECKCGNQGERVETFLGSDQPEQRAALSGRTQTTTHCTIPYCTNIHSHIC